MTLDQLRIFIAVAEQQHVTRAAGMLGLTQSAVSASIAQLEAQHGVVLFNRVGRRIELSDIGEQFLPEARALVARSRNAQDMLDDLANEPRGSLRIHASQTVASYWLPTRLIALHQQFPQIDVQLTVGNTAQAAEAVQEGRADIGLVEGDVHQRNLKRQVVARDELVIIAGRAHPWADRARISPGDYASTTWLLREQGSGTRSEFEAHLQSVGVALSSLDVLFELPSNEAVITGVIAGHSLGLLSRRAVEHACASGALIPIPVDAVSRPFTALTHPERYRSRAAKALFEIIAQGRSADTS